MVNGSILFRTSTKPIDLPPLIPSGRAKTRGNAFSLFSARNKNRFSDSMPEEGTYSPEDIVHDCKVIEAIWEEIKDDLRNKAQVAIAYATCSTLADLIEIKVDHLEGDSDEPIWPPGTSRAYFLEKLTSLMSNFGYVTEKILAGEDHQRERGFLVADLFKFENAFPNFQHGYKAFVRSKHRSE